MTFDDLPIIRCRPTPSDAELQAERDRDHARVMAQYNQQTDMPCDCAGECYGYCTWPIAEVIG